MFLMQPKILSVEAAANHQKSRPAVHVRSGGRGEVYGN